MGRSSEDPVIQAPGLSPSLAGCSADADDGRGSSAGSLVRPFIPSSSSLLLSSLLVWFQITNEAYEAEDPHGTELHQRQKQVGNMQAA